MGFVIKRTCLWNRRKSLGRLRDSAERISTMTGVTTAQTVPDSNNTNQTYQGCQNPGSQAARATIFLWRCLIFEGSPYGILELEFFSQIFRIILHSSVIQLNRALSYGTWPSYAWANSPIATELGVQRVPETVWTFLDPPENRSRFLDHAARVLFAIATLLYRIRHFQWLSAVFTRLFPSSYLCPSVRPPALMVQVRSDWTDSLYSRTSNNGHCRGIQILSVIGGVR
jgi:hypothetical protein